MVAAALLLALPACAPPAGESVTTLSASAAEHQAREVAEELAGVGPGGPVTFRSWGVPCPDEGADRVTVRVTATKPVPTGAVPDADTAYELADAVQERADRLGLPVGVGDRRLELQRENGRSLQLFGSSSQPLSADVSIPIFDAGGAEDDPLWRVEAQARCARIEAGTDPLPGSTREVALAESQAERDRALGALAPLLVSTADVSPQDCARPGERPGAAVTELVLRPGTEFAQVRQALDAVWPTSDGWQHNSGLAQPPQPRLQYRRAALVADYEPYPDDPLRATLEVAAGCYG